MKNYTFNRKQFTSYFVDAKIKNWRTGKIEIYVEEYGHLSRRNNKRIEKILPCAVEATMLPAITIGWVSNLKQKLRTYTYLVPNQREMTRKYLNSDVVTSVGRRRHPHLFLSAQESPLFP